MALFGKITADSFGSDCPSNWEELADYMNGVAAMRLERLRNERQGELNPREESDIYDEVWEDFFDGEFADAPVIRYDEEDEA